MNFKYLYMNKYWDIVRILKKKNQNFLYKKLFN